jgi:hypothetical protein
LINLNRNLLQKEECYRLVIILCKSGAFIDVLNTAEKSDFETRVWLRISGYIFVEVALDFKVSYLAECTRSKYKLVVSLRVYISLLDLYVTHIRHTYKSRTFSHFPLYSVFAANKSHWVRDLKELATLWHFKIGCFKLCPYFTTSYPPSIFILAY